MTFLQLAFICDQYGSVPAALRLPLQVLGVNGKSSSITEFTLYEGFIKSAVSEETHVISVNARRTIATKVVSR